MTTYLLDANVLIALSVAEHEHHDRASRWLSTADRFAVCPVVEGALVRFVIRIGEAPATASALLSVFHEHPLSEFWSDGLSYRDVDIGKLQGHREVTDNYLTALAAHHEGRLATFDEALAARSPDSAYLVP